MRRPPSVVLSAALARRLWSLFHLDRRSSASFPASFKGRQREAGLHYLDLQSLRQAEDGFYRIRVDLTNVLGCRFLILDLGESLSPLDQFFSYPSWHLRSRGISVCRCRGAGFRCYIVNTVP